MEMFHPGCSRSIMICALPRSGSNLLCEAMGVTQKLGNPDEWLNQDRHFWNCGRFGLDPEVRIDGMIAALQAGTRTLNGVFAHKILRYSYTYLMDSLRGLEGNAGLPDGGLLQRYFPDLRLLYIRREDRLAQAISLLKASQSEVWHYNERKRGQASPIHFTWLGIQSILNDLAQQEADWNRLFEESGIPCLELLYEELTRDLSGSMRKVCEFLGIECERYQRDPGRLSHKKTRDSLNEAWRQRFLELNAKMAKSGPIQAGVDTLGYARIETSLEPIEVEAGAVFTQVIQVTNTSGDRWEEHGCPAFTGWIQLASQIIGPEGTVFNDPGTWRELQHPVEPGQSFAMEIALQAPLEPGEYTIWTDLVLSPDQWFHPVSDCGVQVPLVVRGGRKRAFIHDYLGGARELEAGSLYESGWFGQFHLNDFPKLYHFGLGYLDCSGPGIKEDRFVFESEYYGRLATTSTDFPEFWSEREKARLKWHRGTHVPPMLSKWENGEWVPFNYSLLEKNLEAARVYFGAEADAEGLMELDWFGKLEVRDFPRVRHELLGTVWFSGPGVKENSFFFHRPTVGWLWTSSESYPHIIVMDSREWFLVEDLIRTVF